MKGDNPESPIRNKGLVKTIKHLVSASLIAVSTVLAPIRSQEIHVTKIEESLKLSPKVVGFIDFNWKQGDQIPDFLRTIELDGSNSDRSIDWRGYLLRRANHGDMVINTYTRTLGIRTEVSEIPKLNLFSSDIKLTEVNDRAGNIGHFLEANVSEISDFIESQKDTKVFNMSFQLGKTGVFEIRNRISGPSKGLEFEEVTDELTKEQIYFPKGTTLTVSIDGKVKGEDGKGNKVEPIRGEEVIKLKKQFELENTRIVKLENPYLEEVGAFSLNNSFRKENLEVLSNLRRKFRDKTFVISVGNNSDNMLGLGELPNNIVLAGRWGEKEVDGQAFGFSYYGIEGLGIFYIDNDKWDINTTGSSNSAPVVTALLRLRMEIGDDPSKAIDFLKRNGEIIDGNYILRPELRK